MYEGLTELQPVFWAARRRHGCGARLVLKAMCPKLGSLDAVWGQ